MGALDLSKLDASEVASDQEVNPVVVPDEIQTFVNAAHTFWKTSPKKWRKIDLGSADAVTEAKKLASKWAKATGRTFREKKQPAATVLVYKVTDAVRADAPTEPTNG